MKTIKLFTKAWCLMILFISLGTAAQAQILDLESTTEGVLIPRMTTAEKNAIPTPAQSLMVYDTDTKTFWYYKDAAWSELGAGASPWTEVGGEIRYVGTDTLGRIMIAPNGAASGDDSEIFFAEDDDGTWGMGIKYDGVANQLSIYGKSIFGIYGPHLSMSRDSGGLSLGTWNEGSSGSTSHLLLSGAHNEGNNNSGYKLKIEGYNNDGTLVYPIHVMDENQRVDFYLLNRATELGRSRMYVQGLVGIGTESPEADLHVVGSGTLGRIMIAPNAPTAGNDSEVFFAEDDDGTFGMGIKYDGAANQLRIFGKGNSATSGPHLSINRNDGRVAIATSSTATGYALSVGGDIICEELVVELEGNWPDYVFLDDYKLKSLKEVKAYITEKGHLPGVPSAKEIKDNGIQLGEMNKVLMEKIEELTLYILEQEEKFNAQEKRLKALEAQIK